MSALAKLTMMTSKAVSLTALMTASAMPGSGHLRSEIIRCHLLRRNENAVLAGKWLLDASVEEVGDVGVLLGLGDAKVAQVGIGHDVREEIVHRLRRNNHRDGEVLVVLRHAHVVNVRKEPRREESRDRVRWLWADRGRRSRRQAAGNVAVAGKHTCNLANAVGAIVEADADIVRCESVR